MKLELYKLADEVEDEKTFIAFLKALADDWEDDRKKESEKPSSPYGPSVNGWENGDIGMFLDAAHSWAESSNYHPHMETSKNPWTRAAQIIFAGKGYE